jgi:hypothetical protein
MDAPVSAQSSRTASASSWRAVRAFLAILLVWGGFELLSRQGLIPRGERDPVTLLMSRGVLLSLPAVLVWSLAGVYLAMRIAAPADPLRSLLYWGVGLALWAAAGGDMDDWLIDSEPSPGPGRGAPYLRLLVEYVPLLLITVGVALIGRIAMPGSRSANAAGWTGALRDALNLSRPATWRDGVLALVTCAAIAGAAMIVLMGPAIAHTRCGQVYFAVAVSFWAAVKLTRRISRARHPACYWLAPFPVGIAGLLIAAYQPTLPGGYNAINAIPSSALARPLPVELVAVGVASVIWTLRATARQEQETGEPAG